MRATRIFASIARTGLRTSAVESIFSKVLRSLELFQARDKNSRIINYSTRCDVLFILFLRYTLTSKLFNYSCRKLYIYIRRANFDRTAHTYASVQFFTHRIALGIGFRLLKISLSTSAREVSLYLFHFP